ncbi:MAG TPA: protein kinase [Polyangiaceae bacterium]|nr:protein kinase [Polyangiaceae bacterium]
MTDPLIGRSLAGRYEITGLLGEGGMGRVYQGVQRTLGRPVAIKCIHAHLLSSEPVVVRFLEEARVASQILHPNIVKIYDFGRTEPPDPQTLFLVMERLTGPDLGTVIACEGPLPLVRVRAIMLQVLSALGEAHARGVTHRDAKPDNVILEPTLSGCERVKLIDFGIAKVHGAPSVTAVGQFIGTPCYMAPEQIRGERVEVSADLYSVGITLFQMLTGQLPFVGETLMAVLEQQLYAKRPDPREVAAGIECPASLSAVCLRALDADPAKRYPSADLFAEALEDAFAEVLPPESRRSPYPAPPRSTSRPRIAPLGTADTLRPSAAPPSSLDEPAALSLRHQGKLPDFGPELDAITATPHRTATPHQVVSKTPRVAKIPLPERKEAPGVDLHMAEGIERAADEAIAAGDLSRAEEMLSSGRELGQAWLVAGEREAAAAALMVFGRKLGVILRRAGRLQESEEALKTALEFADDQELSRARVLVELVATLGDAGRVTEAEAHRLEALRVAARHTDRELTARLRRQAQSLALALATNGARARKLDDGAAPLKPPSDFRMRVDRDTRDVTEGAGRRR